MSPSTMPANPMPSDPRPATVLAPTPAGSAPVRAAATRPGRLAYASVEVHADPRAVLDAWRDLAAAAPASPYQSPDWMLPWVETVGAEAGVAPLIVVARGADGRAEALLPLGLSRRGGLAVATFLGAKDSNFNMGLFRPGAAWTGEAVLGLLRGAAAADGARVDLYALRNQPHDWEGAPNPLAALPHQPSPSFAYRATLDKDPETFLRGLLSRDTRKKLRQKAKRLSGLGAVELVQSGTPAAASELLDAFAAQRAARNIASGFGTEDLPALRRFLDRTVADGGPVTVYGLRCGGRIVATLAGARGHGRFCGMLTSFDADPEVARSSPGELLLSEVMRMHCAAGTATFDLGVGEARYKESYCPEVQPLFDSLVGVTAKGRLLARAEAARLQLKRSVKQSRWAWPLAQRLRRIGAG